ncbi:MAG: class I SAM-dependent methyltransferase [Gaiellaceae bacterium]
MDERLAAELEVAAVPPEVLTRRLYRLALRRDPEPEALARVVSRLAAGTLSRATLLEELVSSAEFERVRALDDAVTFAAWARTENERPRELRGPPACDERVIEIPWTLSRYRGEPRVLDLGYAHAEPAYLAALTAAVPDEVTGVDLVEADVPGIRPVVADLRSLPFDEESFDVAFCISTLEHVGYDNTRYGVKGGRVEGGMEAALAELLRVLGDSGRLLLTVPCGPEQDFGWYVRLPAERWRRLFEGCGFAIIEDEVYGRTDEGWQTMREAEVGEGCFCVELAQRGTLAYLRRMLRRLRG